MRPIAAAHVFQYRLKIVRADAHQGGDSGGKLKFVVVIEQTEVIWRRRIAVAGGAPVLTAAAGIDSPPALIASTGTERRTLNDEPGDVGEELRNNVDQRGHLFITP